MISLLIAGLQAGVLGLGAAPAPAPAITPVTLGGTPAQVAALLLSAAEGGDLRFAVGAQPLAAEGSNPVPPIPMLIVVHLDGASLLGGLHEGAAGIEVHAYAIAEGGEVAAAFSEAFRLDLADGGRQLRGGGVRHLGRLDLAPGSYALRVLVRNRRTQAFGLRHAGLVVPAPGDSSPAPAAGAPAGSWLEARSPGVAGRDLPPLPAATAATQPAPALPPPSAPRVESRGRTRAPARKEIVAAYRRTLGLLAAGDRSAAIEALAELERRTAGGDPQSVLDGLADLKRAQNEVIDGIAAREPSLLFPLVLLHLDVGRHHRSASAWLLARHSLAVALALADGYAERSSDEGARQRAAQTVMLVAGVAIESQAWQLAQELMASAVKMAPHEPSVLLCRAALAARVGNRDVERISLTTLLARDPRHREARLRRALLASREGEERRAEETLGGLAREPQNDWITSLAYQELGRLLLERREYARAITLLAEGSARLPEDQPLLTALAYGYERAGRISALRATLARLQPRAAAGMTPRQRISQAPAAELAELRQVLLAAALLRQGELAGALPGAAARSGG